MKLFERVIADFGQVKRNNGYSLAEIIGEKYVEGGLLQWKGIRGGVTETARHGENKFCVESRLGLKSVRFLHRIEVAVSKRGARVSQESLHHNEQPVFSTYPSKGNSEQILVQPDSYPDRTSWLYCDHSKPILSQFLQLLRKQEQRAHLTQAVVHSIDDLKSMRFLDLSPEAMRRPSIPGQTTLGDRGENLSSVQTPFAGTDPSATIDEMRERLRRSGASLADSRVAEADRELEAERARDRVEDALSRYKQGVAGGEPQPQTQGAPPQAASTTTSAAKAGESSADDEGPGQSKTLGRTDGPVRPID